MNITIVMDGRFEWAGATAYSSHMAYDPFVERFLRVFGTARICARAYDVSSPTGFPVSGPRADFVRLGNYRGAKRFVQQLPELLKGLWRLAGSPDPVLAYLPGTLPIIFGFMRLARRRPLYSLVVADPADQLQKGALRHPLRRLVRFTFVYSLRCLLKQSSGAMYVTKNYLQEKYPAPKGKQFATSDVFIRNEDIAAARSASSFDHSPKILVYVAMMAQNYKGHDDLIRAFAKARASGADIRLKLIGDGPLRPKIEEMAKEAGIGGYVSFSGKVAHGQAMIQELDSSDLFVMTSRAEGLPRAMVEAMARGLPVISTGVGGVPELISKECIVPANDPQSFTDKLLEAISDCERLGRLSSQNIVMASDYTSDKVDERIQAFYRFIYQEASYA